jgi:hypothetical protein
MLATVHGLRFLVLDGRFTGQSGDGLVAWLSENLGADRVISLGAPPLEVLRDLCGLGYVLASLHVDTGTHHVAATVPNHVVYYLTGPRFHGSSSNIVTWCPPSRLVHPLFSDGSKPTILGQAIAQDMVRHSHREPFLNVSPAIVERVGGLNFRGLRRADESAFNEILAILNDIVGDNPDNVLLHWHVAHALMSLEKVKISRNWQGNSFLKMLDGFPHLKQTIEYYACQFELNTHSPFNEFFSGPLMRQLLHACGLDPYSMAQEIFPARASGWRSPAGVFNKRYRWLRVGGRK